MKPARNIKEIVNALIHEKPVIIDTETTGLRNSDEIIEIAVVDIDGTVLVNTLIHPAQSVPLDASGVHGITEADIKNAPTFDIVWKGQLEGLFQRHIVCTYNADFDIRMFRQTLRIYGFHLPPGIKTACIMKLFAEYRGNWDSRKNHFKWFKLKEAAELCGIDPAGLHRALQDTLLAREVLLCMGK